MSGLDLLGCLFLIGMGAGVLVVAWQGWQAGELRAGPGLFGGGRPTREDNPLAFHFFFVVYLCGGAALAVWGLLALVGMAPPPKW